MSFANYTVERINMKPIIGVSCNFRPHEDEKGSFILDRSYIDAIYKAGGIQQIIPILPHEEIDTLIQLYDGILISGGGGLLPKIKQMKTLPDLQARSEEHTSELQSRGH